MTATYLFLPFVITILVPFMFALKARAWVVLASACGLCVLCAAAQAFNPDLTLAGDLKALGILLAHAWFAFGVAFFFSKVLKGSAVLAQLCSTGILLIACYLIFMSNPLIEAISGTWFRGPLIYFIVNFNPMLAVYAHGFGADMLRMERMYEISLIGSYYPYYYASFIATLGYFAAAGAALFGAGAGVVRMGMRTKMRKGTDFETAA